MAKFPPIIDICADGIRYRLNIENNSTDRKILVSPGRSDQTEIRFLEAACRGGVFVDIGANIGLYSLVLAARGAERIIAIEPNPSALDRLRYNLRINDCGRKVSVVPCGIGPRGRLPLYTTGGLGKASMRKADSANLTSIDVECQPLLDVLMREGIDRVGGLKIDVEGLEDKALIPFFQEAPRALWPRRMVIEQEHAEHWETDLMTRVFDCGYRISKKAKGNLLLERES